MSSIETPLENEHTWQRINLGPYLKQFGFWIARIVLALIVPAIVLAIWQYAVQKQWLAEQILPSPALVWQTTLELIDTHELQDNLWISLKRVAWSVLVGGILVFVREQPQRQVVFGFEFLVARRAVGRNASAKKRRKPAIMT